MPIAAVPHYLGDDFSQATPGLRFGMYLNIWGVDRRTRARLWDTHDLDDEVRGQERRGRQVKKENKRSAIDAACKLTDADRSVMTAWAQRQAEAAAPLVAQGLLLELHAQVVAPFATGLGSEHPTENGFAFLWPYGLPYLPGSGVKGVLRQAAREFDWPHTEVVALFGSESPQDREKDLVRGALAFWDVLPQIAGDHLRVEVMTPHQTHYYQPRAGGQRGQARNTAGSYSPHDSGQPNPIYFLSVPPGSRFVFRVGCDPVRLTDELRVGARWQQLVRTAVEHAFEWLGFGAKTAVGYGAMRCDAAAQQTALDRAGRARADAAKRQMTAGQRRVTEYEEAMAERAQALMGRKTAVGQTEYQAAQKLAMDAQSPDWNAAERVAAADAIERWGERLIRLDRKELRKRLGLAALRAGA